MLKRTNSRRQDRKTAVTRPGDKCRQPDRSCVTLGLRWACAVLNSMDCHSRLSAVSKRTQNVKVVEEPSWR